METIKLIEVIDSKSRIIFGHYLSWDQVKKAIEESDLFWWEGEPVFKELTGVGFSI
ncbi:hypothetical protein [Brevibacillus daliensis]|uniref:hypothetical protein n=1 Tax=Brevibacillus daliensis TaxID=2892995 RepID=UPI001E3376F8|nr:hypothetical protein [Brevibacillus daliensis]